MLTPRQEAAILATHCGEAMAFWARRVEHLAGASDGVEMTREERAVSVELANVERLLAAEAFKAASALSFDQEEKAAQQELDQLRGRMAFGRVSVDRVEELQSWLAQIQTSRAQVAAMRMA